MGKCFIGVVTFLSWKERQWKGDEIFVERKDLYWGDLKLLNIIPEYFTSISRTSTNLETKWKV